MVNNHSTPSYLELKGALVCLGGALAACLRNLYDTHDDASYRNARSILSTARDAVRAELEALKKSCDLKIGR